MKYYNIILGSNCIIFYYINGLSTVKKLLVYDIDKEKEEIKRFFLQNKKCYVYLFLDNINQNYNIKKFPLLLPWDLIRITNRKFNFEIPKEDLRAKIFIGRNGTKKEYEYLFASTAINGILEKLLELINTFPNLLCGIYFVPLEINNLINKLFKKLDNKKTSWSLLLFENEENGLRQIVLKNGKFLFTRTISNEIYKNEKQFNNSLLFFENDILKTINFIRRFDSDFQAQDLQIFSFFTKQTNDVFSSLKLQNIKINVLDNRKLTTLLGKKYPISCNGDVYCDGTIAKFIKNNKHTFNFATKEMKRVLILVKMLTLLKIVCSFLLLYIIYNIFVFCFIFINFKVNNYKIKKQIIQVQNKLEEKKQNNDMLKDKNPELFIEQAKLYLYCKQNSFDNFNSFDIIKKHFKNNIIINDYSMDLDNFNYKDIKYQSTNSAKVNIKFSFINKSGEPDILIENYNNFIIKSKTSIPNLVMQTLNRQNINFNSKYFLYDSTMTININGK